MAPEFSRVEQRLLGLVGVARARQDAEAELPTRLVFSPAARATVLRHAYATGQLQGGVLFGSSTEGVVRIEALVANRPLGQLSLDPLVCDASYVLGAAEQLRAMHGPQVDWVGNWLIQPSGQLGAVEAEWDWLRRGAASDLFNRRQVLCCLGWQAGAIQARVWVYSHADGEIGELDAAL